MLVGFLTELCLYIYFDHHVNTVLIKSWELKFRLNMCLYSKYYAGPLNEKTNYDVSGMRRYGWNILQWNKNDIKST